MRVLVQRVLRATVEVDGLVESRIGSGLLVYVGLRKGENVAKVEKLAKNVAKLHLFPELADPEKVFSSSVIDNGYEILVVAQPSLCAGFDKQTPKAASAIDSAETKTVFNAFVRALQAEYQEEMVVAAPLSPLLQVESSGDGPGMYMFDSDASAVASDSAASRSLAMSVKQETSALEPTIESVTEALRRVPMLKGSKATLESCRIFRVFSMKKFRASLADAGQAESDEFAEALDSAGSFFSRTQQAQITEWTGLAITASPEDPVVSAAVEDAAGGADDFEADDADAEAADHLAQSLAELRGEVAETRFAANADKAARRPDWRGRAAPNTPAGAHASAWNNSRFGKGAPWQSKGQGKGYRPPGRSYGIASLDEANRLHGNDGSQFEYGQLMRVSDRQVHVAKKELDDDESPAAKRRATASNVGVKRPKGTPTIAPMCPDAANPLDEL